jgi:hypothetical protein
MIYIRTNNKAKSAFTLGVKDFSIKSHNTKLVIYDLNLFTMKILC